MTTEVFARLTDVATPQRLRERYLQQQFWTTATLSDSIRRHGIERPDRIAIVDLEGSRRISFGELDAQVDLLAHHLSSLGIGTGDVVAVQLPNCAEAVVADLAVLRINAILNPMLPAYRDREVEYMTRRINTTLLITPGTYRGFDHAAMAAGLCESISGLQHLVLAPGSLRLGDSPAKQWDGARRELGAVSMVLFSSGTEAAPKAIMHTEQTTGAATSAARSAVNLTDADVIWTPTPIAHSTGFNYGVRIALDAGLPLVLQDRWNSAEAIRLIQSFGCSFTVGVPTVLRDLISQCHKEETSLPSMRLFYTGGAPVESALVIEGDEVGIGVYRLYGSTETLAATMTRPDCPLELRAQTDGTALSGVELQVRMDGESVEGQGEVFVRSPSASVGLAQDMDRTRQIFDADGWIKTGDLGVLSDHSGLSIVGRVKEILIRGGMNIAPREIEDLLLKHPDIAQVAVIGLPDSRLGERCCAVVILHEGAQLSLPDLVSYLLSTGLAAYKLPEQLVIRPDFPVSETGKVLKKVLVQQLAESSP